MISRTRAAVLAAALLLPLIALGTWYALVTQNDGHAKIGQILEELGYLQLVPPSRLFGPGTIITVENLPNGAVKLHSTCTMNKEALAALWEDSPTNERGFTSYTNNTLSASAKAERMATSSVAGKQTERNRVSLKNVRVVTISQENLIKVRGDYLKGTCEEAIVFNLRARADVCQVEEVLQADINSRMHFANGLKSEQKVAPGEHAAGSLALTADKSGVNETSGNGLFYGVRRRLEYCFSLEDSHQQTSISNPTGASYS